MDPSLDLLAKPEDHGDWAVDPVLRDLAFLLRIDVAEFFKTTGDGTPTGSDIVDEDGGRIHAGIEAALGRISDKSTRAYFQELLRAIAGSPRRSRLIRSDLP